MSDSRPQASVTVLDTPSPAAAASLCNDFDIILTLFSSLASVNAVSCCNSVGPGSLCYAARSFALIGELSTVLCPKWVFRADARECVSLCARMDTVLEAHLSEVADMVRADGFGSLARNIRSFRTAKPAASAAEVRQRRMSL